MPTLTEADEKLKLALEAVATHLTITVHLRFVTLGSFVALNGLFLSAFGAAWAKLGEVPGELLGVGAVIIAFANFAFFLLERRTTEAHQTCLRIGKGIVAALLIKQTLDIYAQVPTVQHISHGKTLQRLYFSAMIVWLAATAGALVVRPHGESGEAERKSVAAIVQDLDRRVDLLEKRLDIEPRMGVLERRVAKLEARTLRKR